MKKRAAIAVISIVWLIFAGVMGYAMGLQDFIPRLRASAVSPDGAFTVKVYEKRLFPRPIFARIGASAQVYDSGGNLVYEKLIYGDDDFDDTVGNSFNQISFEGDEIRIGPGVYDPKNFHLITMSELKSRTDK